MSDVKDYLPLPLSTFLSDLASKSATPGGGSTAALVGAAAAAQARMVVAYTIGKKDFEQHKIRLDQAMDELRRAQDGFAQLMSEDMAAYERFADARKSPETAERQRAVATAAAVPLEVVALAAAVAGLLDEIKDIVNPYLYSDLQVSAVLAFACARAAAFNVEVNLKSLTDAEAVDRIRAELSQLLDKAHAHRKAVVHHGRA
jgi:formiminotetrahydrofolate cyclodeaminase